MDVLMPDGTLIQNVPEGVTKAQLQAKLSGSAPVEEPKRSMMDYVKALGEVPATLASGAIAQPVGAAYGAYKGITSPQYGTQAGVEEGRQAGAELAQKLQFQPTSPVTKDILGSIGKVTGTVQIDNCHLELIGNIDNNSGGFLYNNDGSLREFGVGYKNKTILPLWLFSIVLGILTYVLVLYYLTYPKII